MSLATDLANHPGIDTAYQERNLREPAPPWVVTDDALTHEQDYVYGAGASGPQQKFGINARNVAVWGQFSGAGIGFVDVERGWRYSHQDFPPRTLILDAANGTLVGRNLARDTSSNDSYIRFRATTAEQHGTSCVGIVVGKDNGTGTVGIAPGATLLGCASRVADDGIDQWQLTQAIVSALTVMLPGDVLLLEVETAGAAATGGYPVEVDAHHFDAIRLASAIGIVVIEPAGNGWFTLQTNAHDLDAPIPAGYFNPPSPILNRNDPGFTDSGAVMVSSCASATHAGGHVRYEGGSYGSRIDCYAWGEDIHAPSANATASNSVYNGSFGGTSGAAAIIAGVALLVQEMAVKSAAPGTRLSPAQLRALLQREDLGTPVYDTSASAGAIPVGFMPDLALILGAFQGLPDVFIRDQVGDDGSVPALNVAQSPDIIVKSSDESDPDAAFGETSGLAEATPPNETVKRNQKSYIFVRMRNRGTAQADAVVATVYWAEAGAYIPPTDWHLIGSAPPISVLPAGTLVGKPYGPLAVTQAIEWTPTAATLPVDHACFIAILHHPLDPAPPPLTGLSGNTAIDWTTFLNFIGGQNNAAWRNFNILPLGGSGLSELLAQAVFNLNGPPDEAAEFAIEVEREGPRNHRWSILVPHALARALTPELARRVGDPTHGRPDDRYELAIEKDGEQFSRVRFAEGARHRCSVKVVVERSARPDASTLSIAQRCRGRLVGRVTFAVNKHSWPR